MWWWIERLLASNGMELIQEQEPVLTNPKGMHEMKRKLLQIPCCRKIRSIQDAQIG
jgi:hypothetical protein